MTGKTIYIESLGCAKNLVDSEVMLAVLLDSGCAFTAMPEDADIIIVNTCGFISDAVEETLQTLNSLTPFKQGGRCETFIVCGCLVERFREKLNSLFPEVDLFLGTGEYPRIASHIRTGSSRRRKNRVRVTRPAFLPRRPAPRIVSTPPGSAYLKISEGCSHRCTFCTIPLIKGAYRSRSVSSILKEAQVLAEAGIKEINLVGQDTTAFTDLPKLLQKLAEIGSIAWIRLLYCHPNNLTREMVQTVAGSEKICSYFDMPLQHISDRILKKMGRQTTRRKMEEKIDIIRSLCPDAAIRTTFIVGFPGETEKEFEALLEFVTVTGFDNLGAFAYSDEPETPSFRMKGKLPETEKTKRYTALMSLQQQISAQKNRRHIGHTITVLSEGACADNTQQGISRAAFHAPEVDGVVFLDRVLPAGSFADVSVSGASAYDLSATVLAERAYG